ncbi:hypothetical protein O0I10_009327 [Lichtheimia ornata]|uniref:Uncharacterized protein n=1 Tax=Lichtheimia ornata TaxID=688661 RepID=A0AAD7UYC3_9FUNG|nr:uncharacterized protein O0I10_009327 [Lichtheimia ornata]KAJ8654932.1 hypothetical protein O0I10_009327 [Lichtheimia ornata]
MNKSMDTRPVEALDEICNDSKPYWEARLVLSKVESLMNDPIRSCTFTSQERQEIVTILSSSSQPTTRWKYYAQDIVGDNDANKQKVLQIPPRKQQELLDMVDAAMQAKYEQVMHLLGSDNIQLVQDKQQSLQQSRGRLILKRRMLTRLVNHYIKLIIKTLKTVWLIIKSYEMDERKKETFTAYYCALTDTLLLRIKILRLTMLLKMYDADFVNALKSLSAIFRTRIDEARIKLSFAEKRIQEYDDLGPEMETIFAAYAGILDEIDKTEDDICKIRQSR